MTASKQDAKSLTLEDMTAAVERAGGPKAEAIANANAYTSDAGLPTYSELVEALSKLREECNCYLPGYRLSREPMTAANSLLVCIPT